jgi:hypothetical protein
MLIVNPGKPSPDEAGTTLEVKGNRNGGRAGDVFAGVLADLA